MASEPLLMRRVPAPVGAPVPYVLMPQDALSAEALAKIPLNENVAVTIKRGRSLQQHKLFWAVLDHVAQASEWETKERLLTALKVRLGRYDLMQLPSGKAVPVPHSISFSAMPQDDFQQFMDESLRVICAEVLPGTDSSVLMAEVQALIGGAADPTDHERAA